MENETYYTNIEDSKVITIDTPEADPAEKIDTPQLSIYEANKQLLAEHGKVLSPIKLKTAIDNIAVRFRKWVWDDCHKYFMLLCKDRSDYTLFNITAVNFDMKELKEALKDCFKYRGDVYDIHYEKDTDAYEIWLKIDNEFYAYYLFHYDIGVIEVGGIENA